MQSDFSIEREFARKLIAGLNDDQSLQAEVLAAMNETLTRYDTGPFENRFGVGGVMEQILGSAARALGLEVLNAGARLQKYDLELKPGVGVSVKSSFGKKTRSSRVRITNSQGATGVWNTGTLFILTGIGIGYADSDLAPNVSIHSGDGKSLDVALHPLFGLWGITPPVTKGPAPQWLSQLATPESKAGFFLPLDVPDRSNSPSPRLVSDPIALDILQSGKSPRLLSDFRWSV